MNVDRIVQMYRDKGQLISPEEVVQKVKKAIEDCRQQARQFKGIEILDSDEEMFERMILRLNVEIREDFAFECKNLRHLSNFQPLPVPEWSLEELLSSGQPPFLAKKAFS